MSPTTRRVLQAIFYEIGAIAITTPIIKLAFNESASSSIGLAVVMSTIALSWNYIFNGLFELWEARQAVKGRTIWRRLAHGICFEGGLVAMLVPLMAYWLNISFLNAFYAEIGILLVFFVYAVSFTWAFDKVFGLPESAK